MSDPNADRREGMTDVKRTDDFGSTAKILIALVMVGIAIAWFVYRRDGMQSSVSAQLNQVQLVPLFQDEPVVDNAALEGKVTLINFWATWCGPCVAEFPHLLRINDAYRDHHRYQFVSVSVGQSNVADLRAETQAFLRTKGYDLPMYYDPDGQTRGGLEGVTPGYVPVTILVGPDGKVVNVAVGFDEAKLSEMNLQIASLLSQK